jgi:hypothetical protein
VPLFLFPVTTPTANPRLTPLPFLPGGGKTGTNLKYAHDAVRGDLMGWFNGVEETYPFAHLPMYGKKVAPATPAPVRRTGE